ncbi:hypothetical protein C8A05DRAFT_18897 [Staphylotrichum tortipilum]|uniref:Uncharacterized protein n=1 Tax=Staphylotrichum tortipilum TaxID=2831512 RepID=A0AAN6RQK9_9PEZI|nr:hypothetical protein C8A05DRAFT_18897 [Staphylotrichum longicolle]
MTTQQSEGAILVEKPLKAASLPIAKDGPNGSPAINGHSSVSPPPSPSPLTTKPDADSETATKPNGDARATTPDAIPAAPAENTKPDDQPGKEEPERDIATGLDKVKMDDATAPADTDMPDAPVEPLPLPADDHQSDEALSPKSHPKPQPEAQPASKEKTPPNDDAVDPVEPAGLESADALTKKDVTMGGTEEPAASPAAPATSETKQETTVTDATTAPAVEAELAPKPSPSRALTPPPPPAAETTTSDSAQPSAKVSRERDIDSEDEPVAKRTKVEHADQVQVKTDVASAAGDKMEVDRKPGAARPSPQVAGGGRKKLDDESLNNTPMTEWQSKQIRIVLAGVKKTKVGALFRLPVQHLWPQLWADYSTKVSNPTDISTMEKRLRGDGPRYATMGDFKRDLDLMVENAVSFNGEGHDVTLQAKACREAILNRMATSYASEPPKPEKKESGKAHPTRHAEPRAPVAPAASTPSAASRPSKPAEAAPAPKPAVPESPAFALPPGSNGVPLIRRDSTKPDSRAKRPVKPAHSKDLVYDTKRKKKLPLDLRFCDEVLIELRKTKHYDINAAFLQPVDPVALNIPHYHKVIKRPMDLQTMANKLSAGDYTNAKEFEKDFDLIIKNCKTFNGEDHLVYSQALRLQDLYRAEMSKKDEWMAKHAPVTAAPAHVPAASGGGGHARHESDSDDAESEADHEQDEERKEVENRVATILKRLEPEQKKLNDMVNSGTADMVDVEITQSVVALLQKQLMGERAKLANLPTKKAGGGSGGGNGSKAKPAKSKKSGGGGGGASVSSKKAAVSGGGGGAPKRGGGTKKAAPKKKISQIEKDIIVESLGNLDGPLLERAIDLIKKDTGQGENDAGELELDIDTVSDEALGKLYEIAIKANPNARAEKERQYGAQVAPAAADPPAAKSRGPSSKSKKNKPMSKIEQERRIQQLNELRAQAARQGSGSQEPIESIEGPGGAAEPVAHESEDEVDSEED